MKIVRRRPDFFWNKMRRRQNLSNKMRRRPNSLTKSSWVLCPVNAVCNLFSTNHSSESSSFNLWINSLIHYFEINSLINKLNFGRPIVCLFFPLLALFYQTNVEESLGHRVSSRASQGGTHLRFRIADVPPHPVFPRTTWGDRILTLHLDYVAGYAGPLLFLFVHRSPPLPLRGVYQDTNKQINTHWTDPGPRLRLPLDDQKLLPWRLRCLGESKVRSALLVRVLNDFSSRKS